MNSEKMKYFFTTGRVEFESSDDSIEKCTIVFAGDWAPDDKQAEAILEDYKGFYGDVKLVFQNADMAVINLEGAITGNEAPIAKDGPHLNVQSACLEHLTDINVKLVTLANNHTMDFGIGGLDATLRTLESCNLPAIGAGLSEEQLTHTFSHQIDEQSSIRILNFAEGEEGASRNGSPGVVPYDLDSLCKQIRTLRNSQDIICVVAHAGREYIPIPPPYIQKMYRTLISAGAHCVIGHHPHVPQGVEFYDGGFIAYSLGNFVFDFDHDKFWQRRGFLAGITLSGGRIAAVQIYPYAIEQEGLHLLESTDKQSFLECLEVISSVTALPENVEEFWNGYADRWFDNQMSKEVTEFALTLLTVPESIDLAEYNLRTRQGRLGRILSYPVRLLARYLRNRSYENSDLNVRRQGAAILRNRFDTLAHRELYLTALGRYLGRRELSPAPAWVSDILERWEVFDD